MNKQAYVYLMTNKSNKVIYTGVISDLIKRIYEHKSKLIGGFTKKYNVNKLVYYEIHDDISEAIKREKQIKNWSRQKKIDMINILNEDWKDLYESIV